MGLDTLASQFSSTLRTICDRGYSVLGRTSARSIGRPQAAPIGTSNSDHWQFESGFPPSYSAYGRYRFLTTLRHARALQPKSVLEVAASGGFTSACLYEPGRRMLLNDIRDLRDELPQWTTGEHLTYVPGNFFDLDPGQFEPFDLVMACEVIEHVAHGDRFVAHLKKFLSPGGTLLLTTPNGGFFRSRLPTHSTIEDFDALEKDQFKPDADGHLFFYTRAELEGLLREQGFSSVKTECFATPWMSGHAGLRHLPQGRAFFRPYWLLDQAFQRRERWCAHLLTIAHV